MLNQFLPRKNKEDIFWKWFTKHSVELFHFENNQDFLFNKLKSELDKIDTNLVFEFSPIFEDGTREFVISADGIESSFSSVINLVKNAPKITNWKIVAFRQPRNIDQINYEGLTIKFEDVFFKYRKNSGKINLELNIRGFYESAEWTAGIFLLLDSILGEYSTEMSLDFIDKKELNENEIKDLYPISELPKIITNYKLEFSN